ncbi:MAG: GTP-binding protein Obg/CgtA [Candidatus Saccharibacteria bacterium]|nr:GTP-binding protein Obg/CgtA [Candidatus Saccharibacteria bacterium]
MFVDSVRIKLQAGDGGDGKVSFRHEKFVDRGGPDGGDGGDGGDIVLVASRNQDTLASFRYQKSLKAPSGNPGFKTKKHGKTAPDLEVPVPVGTVVTNEEGEVLADLISDGQRAIIARGGKGGFGNAHFISSTRQTPRVAEKGERGDQVEVQFELKMIADVGIVGLPNAGKSTFLSVVSNAKPEIANYPFTTLHPNLGVVDVDGKTSLLLADIPGLIEGASKGKGLGDEFLRHAERTPVLLHLIDTYNDDVEAAYQTIMTELKEYRVDLSKKPQIVALTKIEGVDKKDLSQKLKKLQKIVPKNTTVMAISSSSGEGVTEAMRELKAQVDKARAKEEKKAAGKGLPVIGLREDGDAWTIEKIDEKFIVTGRKIEKFAQRTHFGDYHAEQRLRDIMRKMGIMNQLGRQGINPEQKIIIGKPPIGSIDY